jgi:hypothetical protein
MLDIDTADIMADITTLSLCSSHKYIELIKGALLVRFNIKTSYTCVKELLAEDLLLLGWSSTSAAYHTILISTLLSTPPFQNPYHPHNFPSTGTSTT